MSQVILWGTKGSPPAYYQSALVTMDGATPFSLLFETNPYAPAGPGGESEFYWAYLQLSFSLGATLRVTPKVDGSSDDVTLDNGDVIKMVRPLITLPQQGGTLQRLTQVFPVPLARAVTRGGVEISRFCLRGQALQLVVESIGSMGSGECMLEAIQLSSRAVRKAIYRTVDSSGT